MMKSRCCSALVVAMTVLAFALPATAEDTSFPFGTETKPLALLPCGTAEFEPVQSEPSFFEDVSPALDEAQPEQVDLAGTTTCNPWVNYGCCLNTQRQRRFCTYRNGTIYETYYEYRCLTGSCAF